MRAGKDLNAVYKDTFATLKPKYGHWVIFDHCMPFDVTRATTRRRSIPTRASGPQSATRKCGNAGKLIPAIGLRRLHPAALSRKCQPCRWQDMHQMKS